MLPSVGNIMPECVGAGETAKGKFSSEAVRIMTSICEEAEKCSPVTYPAVRCCLIGPSWEYTPCRYWHRRTRKMK